MTKTLTTAKGKTVETNLTNDEALVIVQELPGQFAQDLASKEKKYGLSHDQWVWVHVLAITKVQAVDTCNEAGWLQKSTVKVGFEVYDIVSRMTSARETKGIKFPKIVLETEDGQTVALSLAGAKSKSPGTVNVTDGEKYPNNKFFGRITLDGYWAPTSKADEKVVELVVKFNEDPAAVAKSYGKKTSVCCFCKTPIKTDESLTAGYGPDCAANYGLPWGHVDEAVKVTDEDFEVTDETKFQAHLAEFKLAVLEARAS